MRAFLAPIGQDTLTQFRRDVPPKEWAFRATVLCVLHRHIPNEDQPHHVQNDTQFFEGNTSRRANSSGGEGCCRQTVGNMISEPKGGSRYRKACGQFSPRMPLLLLCLIRVGERNCCVEGSTSGAKAWRACGWRFGANMESSFSVAR